MYYADNIPLHPFDHRQCINIEVAPGKLLHIDGVNGCGKTTILKCIAGLVKPKKYQSNINDPLYISAKPILLQGLSVAQQLMYYRIIFDYNDDIGCLFDEVLNQSVDTLSTGWKHRLHLAQVLFSQHDVWLVDEPCSSLDDSAVFWLKQCFKSHTKNGGSIILIDHTKKVIEDTALCLQL